MIRSPRSRKTAENGPEEKPVRKSRMSAKQEEKRSRLLKAAHVLFMEKGVKETSIDDIVRGADVAKGTFYLYFKDKNDLLDHLVDQLSADVIGRIFRELEVHEQQENWSMQRGIFFFIDQLVHYLDQNRELLPILHKNLSRGLYHNQQDHFIMVSNRFTAAYVQAGGTTEEAQHRLYMIVELSNAVLYNAMSVGTPYTLEEIRPSLYAILSRMIQP